MALKSMSLKSTLRPAPLLQLLLLILLALAVLVPLLWLVSTSLKGPAEDIFTSPPSLFPTQPSLDAYGRLFPRLCPCQWYV